MDGGDYTYADAVGTWTGSATEITFTAATNQVRASQIVVTIDGEVGELITYEVFPQQGTSAFALFNGATQIAGSNYGSQSGSQTYSGQVITTLNANDVLTLRNIDGQVTLDNEVPSNVPVISASIVIERLA